ncbi:Ltp family lipoprotein [Kocuria sp. CPCC 205261]|uniref:Ltp family lipoprotein n=1 Tax=Kocuria sp. CPCC 205261 TaxID=3073554 RepID=UPI0034D62716
MSQPPSGPQNYNGAPYPHDYGQQYGGPNGAPPKKKGGCLKILGIIVGLILLFIVLAAACSALGSNSNDQQPASQATESTPAAETPTPAEPSEAATPSEPTAPSEPAVPSAPAAPETPEASEAANDAAGDVPREYSSALNKAESYSRTMHMSKAGIYDQLTSEYGEKFSPEAAQYAVDNMTADWNANALAKAKSYQDTMNMSPAAIQDQLTSEYGEQFTPEQAAYAVANLNK